MTEKNLNFNVARLIHSLPALPANVDELLDSLGKDDLKQRLADLAQKDPAICAELMYLANTHCFGNCESVQSLDDALGASDLEGMSQIIAATFATRQVEEGFGTAINLGRFFSHSQDISISAGILAQICGMGEKETQVYSTTGLMHDVGRVVISAVTKEECAPLMGASVEKLTQIITHEKETVGMDHCEVGMQLVKKWGFNESLQNGILRHHTPIGTQGVDHLGGLIFVSHFVSASDFTGQTLEKSLPGELLKELGIDGAGFDHAQKVYRDREK